MRHFRPTIIKSLTINLDSSLVQASISDKFQDREPHSRFSEGQMICGRKEAEAGARTTAMLPSVTGILKRRHTAERQDMRGREYPRLGIYGISTARRPVSGGGRSRRCRVGPGAPKGRRGPRSSGKKFVTPSAKREAVAHLQACYGMSKRRACRVIDADRKSQRQKQRDLAEQQQGFGYRRQHRLLRQEGEMNKRKATRRRAQKEGRVIRRRRSRT